MSESASAIALFLSRVGRRLTRHGALAALLWSVAAAALLAVIAPMIASVAPRMAGLVAALTALFAAGAVLAIILSLFFLRRRWKHSTNVARYVGTVEADLASDLLSSVELAAGDHPEFSPDLVGALTDATAARVESLEPARVVPLAALKRPAACALAGAAALVAIVSLAPSAMAAGWANLVGSTDAVPFEGAAQNSGPVVGDVEISLQFPDYTGRPSVVLPAAAGDFRAMPGTIARVKTRSLYRAVGAAIVFGSGKPDDGERGPIVMEVTRGGDAETLSAEMEIRSAATYRFLIEEPGGARRVEARGHEIEIEADKAPVVELHTPADTLDVSNTKRVELAYIAKDDYGITKVELVWQAKGKTQRMPLDLAEPGRRGAQSKFLWDLSTVEMPSGGSVPYHLEVSDNDTVSGPNVGKSKVFNLRVFSPRERHEGLVENQRKLFEKLIALLGERLVVAAEDLDAHRALNKATRDIVVDVGTLASALEEDKLASTELIKFLSELRARHDKFVGKERNLLEQVANRRSSGRSSQRQEQAVAGLNREQVSALEDDVIALADWIDRQDLEGMLHIADEIKTHRERLDKLMTELARTGDPAIKAEIERELRALEQRLAELSQKGQKMPSDVSDQFVNRDAASIKQEKGCLAEVRELLAKGEETAAAEKMKECGNALEESAKAMEKALAALREDRFSEEQKEIAELMSSLADLAQDEDDLAASIDELYDEYAEKAAELASKEAKDASGALAKSAKALESRLDKIPEAALTPFAKEELDAVKARVSDLKKMLADGDLSEALAMSRQAETGLETMAEELQADIEDGEPWNKKTPNALEGAKKAQSIAGKLTDALRAQAPAPRDVMDKKAKRKLARLEGRQKKLKARASQVAKKATGAKHLPPMVGQKVAEQLGKASGKMTGVEKRLRAVDPSGARHQAHEAADFLRELTRETQRQTRGAEARGRTSMRDEPVRIPGAEEYKAPAELREELLDAMKKGGPASYEEMLKRYYEELIK